MITPAQGVVLADKYSLVRPLARGGMGSVWLARHLDLEIDVTVKFMAPSLIASTEARTRFEREAKVAARLRSQHVVKVLDYGVVDDTPYIAMELLQGESLTERLGREGRLPLPAMARILGQACKALQTAHEAGLVHRDLKPGNVFLARKDGEEVVQILDFGIAKTTDLGEAQAHTETGAVLGSVHYMSPEQIRQARDVDSRSDLWSLAVILYRALTGRLPFPGQNLGDVLVRVCTDPVPVPSSIAPDLSPRIDAFFERALARDLNQRFRSASTMAETFAAMVAAEQANTPVRPPQHLSTTMPLQRLPVPMGPQAAPNPAPPPSAPVPLVPPQPQIVLTAPLPGVATAPLPPQVPQAALVTAPLIVVPPLRPAPAPALAPAAAPTPEEVTFGTVGSLPGVHVPRPQSTPAPAIPKAPSRSRSPVVAGVAVGSVLAIAAIAAITIGTRPPASPGAPVHGTAAPTASAEAAPPAPPAASTPAPSASAPAPVVTMTPPAAPTPSAEPAGKKAPSVARPVKRAVSGPLEDKL